MELKKLYDAFINDGGSASEIAKATNLSATYVSKSVSGWENYNLSDEKKLSVDNKILNYLKSLNLTIDDKNSVYSDICEAANILEFENTTNIIASTIKSIKQKSFIKICAPSGTGKTTGVKAVALKLPQLLIVTAYSGMSKKELLEDLAYELNIKPLPKTQKELMRSIKKELSSTKKAVVIDEANFIHEGSLEQLRHIHDICGVPMLLVGTEKLDYTIIKSHPQIATRIRNSLPLRAFNEIEVVLLAKNEGIFLDDLKIKKLFKTCKNLREIKYFLEDFREVFKCNLEAFDTALRQSIAIAS